jgi:type I restriction enzyme S subunit
MIKCCLGSIADVTMGQSPKSEYYNANKEGLPFLQGSRTFGAKYPSFDTYTTVPTKIALPNDLILQPSWGTMSSLQYAKQILCAA